MNSSIGATSVRRLIAVVRSTGGRVGAVYRRKVLVKNLVVLCVGHILVTSAFLPFLALQSSVSVWTLPLKEEIVPITINVGSLLLTVLHLLAAVSSIFGPFLVQRFTTNAILFWSYSVFAVFYAAHLFPALYLLLPAYVLLGLWLGPLSLARVSFLMTLSAKLTSEDDEPLRRTCVVRRVARAFKAAHDFGLILGSVLTSLLVTYTVNMNATALQVDCANCSAARYCSNATSNCTGTLSPDARPEPQPFSQATTTPTSWTTSSTRTSPGSACAARRPAPRTSSWPSTLRTRRTTACSRRRPRPCWPARIPACAWSPRSSRPPASTGSGCTSARRAPRGSPP